MPKETTAEEAVNLTPNIVQAEAETIGGDLEVTLTRFRDGTVILGFAKWSVVHLAFNVHLPLAEVLKLSEMMQRLAPAATPEASK